MGDFIRSRAKRSSAGFSLIEVMIAGGLVAFIAIAVMPAIFSVGDSVKVTGFRAQCAAMVRAKLQDYVNGVADSALFGTTSYVPTGFEYTKRRFQQYGNTCALVPAAASPGYREAISSNAANFTGQELMADGVTPVLSRELRGFQLWVMIRHYNPRVIVGGQPARQCPTNYSTYQFFNVGDALEVTVTGMVRVTPAVSAGGRGGAKVGKIGDIDATTPNPMLTCSATEIVYPPRLPFRYYLSTDGKIMNLQAKIALNAGAPGATAEAAEAHFRYVWSYPDPIATYDSSFRRPLNNIRSFAVSPDNRWVWVMRPGRLERYGPCYDTATNVTVDGVSRSIGGTTLVDITDDSVSNPVTLTGIPNCPSKPTVSNLTAPDGLYWRADLNIENITVDFKDLTSETDDVIYGFPNAGAMSVTSSASGAAGVLKARFETSPDRHIEWDVVTDFVLPSAQPRIRGMFIAQTFPSVTAPNMFFFDNTCFTGGSTTTGDYRYCTSLFSSADSTMEQEMRELPLQVEGISH